MKITVLIADDKRETRQNIKTMLGFDERIEVVGEAENGEEAIRLAKKLSPKIILMDVNMPVLDGLKATEEICLTNPDTSIIIVSVQGEQEYLKRAMSAGAREFIIKPFSNEELISTIVKVFEMEEKRKVLKQNQEIEVDDDNNPKVITVFSTKGGVGKTTLSVNLAIGIAQASKKKVALLDLDLQFGDVALMLNIQPKKTIYSMIDEFSDLNEEIIEDYLIPHFSGVRVLCAPTRPEYAEYITSQHVEKIIRVLKKTYNFIVIDTTQSFSDVMLTTLDQTDDLLLVSTVDLPTIKNIRLGLDVLDNLNYPRDRIKFIINKATEQFGVKYKDIESTLKMSISNYIPEDNTTVITYANKGFPFILARSEKKISKCIQELSHILLGYETKEKRSIFSMLL